LFRFEPIHDLELPELLPYRTMRQSVDQYEKGLFVAEGEKVVRRLLESKFTVVSLLLPDRWVPVFEPLLKTRSEPDITVYTVSDKHVLEQLTGFSMFQGVLAVGKIPVRHTLAEILSRSVPPRLFAAVEGLANAENLGALVRNCAAFGVQALIVGETSSSPFLRRSVRNSMGTIFDLTVLETPGLLETLRALRREKFHCVAAHPHAPGKNVAQADFTGDCCIVFGSEGHGLTPDILDVCDEAVSIPMPPKVDSLNVGSAAAVFLYEANRQRGFVQLGSR
jgi:tRNA G18 (ribose-2'-O)-methylase SpoU